MDTQQGGVKSKISQSPQSLQCSVPRRIRRRRQPARKAANTEECGI